MTESLLHCCVLTSSISSACHILSGMFYYGPKPTDVCMENDAVDRRCHQTCLIQKTQSQVATPQFTVTAGILPRLFSILNLPFLFPTPTGSANGFLTPCDHGQLKTSHPPFYFSHSVQSYKVNFTYILDTSQQHGRFGYRGGWGWGRAVAGTWVGINTSECDQTTKMQRCLKAVKLKSRSQCIQSKVKTDHPFENNSYTQNPNSILSFIYRSHLLQALIQQILQSLSRFDSLCSCDIKEPPFGTHGPFPSSYGPSKTS